MKFMGHNQVTLRRNESLPRFCEFEYGHHRIYTLQQLVYHETGENKGHDYQAKSNDVVELRGKKNI